MNTSKMQKTFAVAALLSVVQAVKMSAEISSSTETLLDDDADQVDPVLTIDNEAYNPEGNVTIEDRTDPVHNEFVQISSSSGIVRTCQSSFDRAKEPVDDFWSILNGTTPYSDDDFTPDDSSIYWPELGETKLVNFDGFEDVRYDRISTIFGDTGILFGDVKPDNLQQHEVGDCWLMSAAAAIANKSPDTIKKIFLNPDHDSLSANGIYALRFGSLGVPHDVVIDDILPVAEVPIHKKFV